LLLWLMIPDSVFIRVSFFLAQRPPKANFSAAPRCHSTWRNAGDCPQFFFDCVAEGPALRLGRLLFAAQIGAMLPLRDGRFARFLTLMIP
jgi:hypothetical protein